MIFVLVSGTVFDFQPEEKIDLELKNNFAEPLDSSFTFMTWNIGYCGLGKEAAFFYDSGGFYTSAGKNVRESEPHVKKNIAGVTNFLDSLDYDFLLLQEVDRASKRSYWIDQYSAIDHAVDDYNGVFSVNFRSGRVPVPLLEPWNIIGAVESGLASFSKAKPMTSMRYQLPGEYPWPDRIFHLDRCAAFQWFPLKNGKSLVVVNTHNSAYDKGGKLKAMQLDYLEKELQAEYKKGNYIVIGGDWNQGPLNYRDEINPNIYGNATEVTAITQDFLSDWTMVSNYTVPTNRSVGEPLDVDSTEVKVIDFFYISPNMKMDTVFGVDLGFDYSDHQPVVMQASILK